jgi:hypothetical protein
MRSQVTSKCLFWLLLLLIVTSPAGATTGGHFKFVSSRFSLQLHHAYGSPALESEKYINDGYLAYKYASFLFRKQLFDKTFKSLYQAEPLSIDFEIGVSDEYRNFSSPTDWEINPYVFKNREQVAALPVPKIFTLQLVIYQSPKWLDTFKVSLGQKVREVDLEKLCKDVNSNFFVDGCYNKKHPAYVITSKESDGRTNHYVRYGLFISIEDARNVAEELSRQLGFEVQVLKRTLSRELIRKVLFDESFII